MADYGIKVLKPNAPSGVNVLNAQPKDLTILSTAESHKAVIKTSINAGGGTSYYHGLGTIPFFDAFAEKSNGNLIPSANLDLQIFVGPETINSSITVNYIYLSDNTKKRYFSIYIE